MFEWSGSHEGTGRGDAAARLAQYLNSIADLTEEPLRIIAHSHGCNVATRRHQIRSSTTPIPRLPPWHMVK